LKCVDISPQTEYSQVWTVSPAASLSATTLPKPALSGAEGVVERGVEVVVIDGVGVGDLNHIYDLRFTIVDF